MLLVRQSSTRGAPYPTVSYDTEMRVLRLVPRTGPVVVFAAVPLGLALAFPMGLTQARVMLEKLKGFYPVTYDVRTDADDPDKAAGDAIKLRANEHAVEWEEVAKHGRKPETTA